MKSLKKVENEQKSLKMSKKGWEWAKKVVKGWKEVVRPAFGCTQHLKAGRNTQQPKSLILETGLNHSCLNFQDTNGSQLEEDEDEDEDESEPDEKRPKTDI